MTLVFMFPGQSSRYPEMLEKLIALGEDNRQSADAASEILGRDLRAWYRADNPGVFETNRNVQVGVFLANHLYAATLERHGIDASMSLGLSLGEYNHLVHIGALDFADGLRLVDRRGQLYDDGPDGMMVSAFPIDVETLQSVVDAVRQNDILEIANLNSPRQQVLSGDRAAIERAVAVLSDEHFLDPVVIEQKIPMHSTRFAPVSDAFRVELQRIHWRVPNKPYLPNVLGEVLADPAPADFVDLLSRHVSRPVLWRKSIEHIVADHADARFVEVGPRGVLTNLLEKKWLKNPRWKTDSPDNHPEIFRGVVEELRNAA